MKLTKEECWWAGGPAERPALEFLRDNGPHTIGPIDTDGAFAAALVFTGLESQGLVTATNFGTGNVQYAITEAGRTALANKEDR